MLKLLTLFLSLVVGVAAQTEDPSGAYRRQVIDAMTDAWIIQVGEETGAYDDEPIPASLSTKSCALLPLQTTTIALVGCVRWRFATFHRVISPNLRP